MSEFPKVIASSVIRSAHEGESHGGVYLVDVETGEYEQVIDWNDEHISWEGRGGERGLRGIAISNGDVYLAGSDRILVYDDQFNLRDTYSNKYLGQCHEIYISGRTLFITSTGFDSVLEFDLDTKRFTRGYCLRSFDDTASVFELDPVTKSLTERTPSKPGNGSRWVGPRLREMLRSLIDPMQLNPFDPNSDDGPLAADKYHINNVLFADGAIYLSGTGFGSLLSICEGTIHSVARIPNGTHNVKPFRDGVIFNDTAANRVACVDRDNNLLEEFPIVSYEESELLMSDVPKDYARQAFGRGLCLKDDDMIIGGSSPATVSVYKPGSRTAIKTINLTMDVRNSIHGLEIWPY